MSLDTQSPIADPPARIASNAPVNRFAWRVVDIVVAAVLGVAVGLVFWVWNLASGPVIDGLMALVPGLGGLVGGLWLIGGVLGGLVIRKPGAAIFVELVAALVAALLGSAWGLPSLVSGLCQGLGAELIFLIFAYRHWNLGVAALAGVGAGAVEMVWELLYYYPAYTTTFKTIYVIAVLISGAVLAGLLGWLLTRALAATGALNRFESGRAAQK